MNQIDFKNLGVDEKIASHLHSLGFQTPTPIQKETLPLSLQKKDIIAKAHTGSGKTLAFSLPILNNFDPNRFDIQTLVLTPTRELAMQVADELRKVIKYHHNVKVLTLCGGIPYKPQVHSLSHKAHILIGTPGRVLKHLENENFNTALIDTFVLDEADRMLDMGFMEDVQKIINYLPKKRHNMLFSATYPNQIESLARSFMENPTFIDSSQTIEKPKIEEQFIASDTKQKDIIQILDNEQPKSAIIFCNTKIDCDELGDFLESHEIYPLVLHSDLEQIERIETLTLFENKSYKILIATDVASRGLDIDNVDLVINYSLPRESSIYTHRIGRTGRGENKGKSISLLDAYQRDFLDEYTDQEDFDILEKSQTKYDDRSDFDTLLIFGGKKQKVRRGDIVGSLTGEYGLKGSEIGVITLLEKVSYVAISHEYKKQFQNKDELKIKGKYYHLKYIG